MSHDNINIDQLLERIKLLEEENARLKATPDLVDVGCNTDGRGDDVCPTVEIMVSLWGRFFPMGEILGEM